MDTFRAKMGPYMKDLERYVGYTSLKIRHSKQTCQSDIVEGGDVDEDDSEITFRIRYKTPIAERDEQIQALQEEKARLEIERPNLLEKLTKANKQLEAERAAQKQKNTKFHQAMKITEQQVSEAIKSTHTTIKQHPQLISLLALFQDRDDFAVDHENQTVKPVLEEYLLEEISKDI